MDFNGFDYDELLELQGEVCGICGDAPDPARRLAVDHDHSTGKIRGLLCSRCNMGLGYFRDDVGTLIAALNYVQHGPRPPILPKRFQLIPLGELLRGANK